MNYTLQVNKYSLEEKDLWWVGVIKPDAVHRLEPLLREGAQVGQVLIQLVKTH